LGVAFQTHPGRQAFISSGSKEPRSALESRRVSVVSEGAEGALGRFALLQSRGADLKFLYLSVIDVLRDAAVLSFTGSEALLSRHAPSSLSQMKTLVAERTREEWMFLLDIAFRSEKDVVATEFPRLGFELLLLRLVNAPSLLLVEKLDAGDASMPRPTRETPPASTAPRLHPPAPAATTFAPRPAATPATPPAAAPAAGHKPAGGRSGDFWEAVKHNLEGKKKVVLVGLLSSLKGRREGDILRIEGPEALISMVRDADKLALLESAAGEVAGAKMTLRFEDEGEKKNDEAVELTPPSKRLEQKAFEDPGVQEYLREFDGNIVEVKPVPPKPVLPADILTPTAGSGIDESANDENDGEQDDA
ncbi:MAG TPA: hypothetical protein VIU29_00655, partial [Candidatus Deferrimicrobiaceae bacterium]